MAKKVKSNIIRVNDVSNPDTRAKMLKWFEGRGSNKKTRPPKPKDQT